MGFPLRTLLGIGLVFVLTWVVFLFGGVDLPNKSEALQEEPVEDPMAELAAWLRLHGATIHRCVEVSTCPPYGGRCLKATCDVQPEELLISVPAALQLTPYLSAKGSPCPQLEEQLAEAKNMHFQETSVMLLLRLLKEHARGRASVFWKYFQTLPADYPSILSDKSLQRQCLAGTPGDVAGRIDRRFLRADALAGLLRGCYVALSQPVFLWAKATLDTRAFSGVTESTATSPRKEWNIFVPFADILNDALEPSATWGLDARTGDFRVAAARAIASGSEVTISYGPKSNEKLLTSYGFVHPDNPRDEATIYLEDSSSAAMPRAITLKSDRAHLRQALGQLDFLREAAARKVRAASADEHEAAALEELRRRCAVAADGWAWAGDAGPNSWMCEGYRGGLVSLAKGCAAFADAGVAKLRGKPPPKPADGSAGRLAEVMFEVWSEDYQQRR